MSPPIAPSRVQYYTPVTRQLGAGSHTVNAVMNSLKSICFRAIFTSHKIKSPVFVKHMKYFVPHARRLLVMGRGNYSEVSDLVNRGLRFVSVGSSHLSLTSSPYKVD